MKILLTLILILTCGLAYADTINETYSFQDYTHQNFLDKDPSEFSNTVIFRSTLYQEARQHGDDNEAPSDPRKHIFPEGIEGVILRECNADNVKKQEGLTIENNCSNRRIRSFKKIDGQPDGRDWVLKQNNKPDYPL